MAINKITAPLADTTANFATPVINQLQALVIDCNHGDRYNTTKILDGALFCIGGEMFRADSDTTISGVSSTATFIKFVVSGTVATPSFVTTLENALTWSGDYQGYYDGDGNYYLAYEV